MRIFTVAIVAGLLACAGCISTQSRLVVLETEVSQHGSVSQPSWKDALATVDSVAKERAFVPSPFEGPQRVDSKIVRFYTLYSGRARHVPQVFIWVEVRSDAFTVIVNDEPPSAHVAEAKSMQRAIYEALLQRFGSARVRKVVQYHRDLTWLN